MTFNQKRGVLATLAVALILVLGVLAAASSLSKPYTQSLSSSSAIGSVASAFSNSSTGTNASLESVSTSSSNTAVVTQYPISFANCEGNCSVEFPWTSAFHMYQTLPNLVEDSTIVLIANVTSESAVLVNGIPVTVYNVTLVNDLLGNTVLKPGGHTSVSQVGGTVGGATMTLKGDPLLIVGGTYVFFLYQ